MYIGYETESMHILMNLIPYQANERTAVFFCLKLTCETKCEMLKNCLKSF